MRALRMSAVARPLTVSCTRSDPRSVDITSLCSELTSTPMYSAAWARATCMAAPSAARAARMARLLSTTHHGRGGLLGHALGLVLQALDVVQLAQHVFVVRQLVSLLHGGGRAVVVARVLVGETEVPVPLGELLALDLGILLPVGDGLREGRLGLLPIAAFRPADAALELRDIGVLLEARGHVFLMRNDRAHEALQHPAPRRPLQRVVVDRLGALAVPGVGVVAPLFVGLGDHQPASGHVDDLEGRARPDLAAQLVDDDDAAVLVLD